MIEKMIFTERQRFKQWWIWLILLGLNGSTLYVGIMHYLKKPLVGTDPMDGFDLVILTVSILFFNLLFFYMKMDTQVDSSGISVRFFPFHWKVKRYNWDAIKSATVRTYSPLTEYGGWGLRGWGDNKAYNVSGNQGLQIEFNDGKKLLIGTNLPEELKQILAELGHA
jgi:hypothetical protein